MKTWSLLEAMRVDEPGDNSTIMNEPLWYNKYIHTPDRINDWTRDLLKLVILICILKVMMILALV